MHKKKVILIRHGEAASTWDGDDRDPGLSKEGIEQAKSINDCLLYTSDAADD